MGYTAFDATAQNQGIDVQNYHAIRRERMIMKRFIAFLLSVMTVFNFICPVAAEQTSTDTRPQFHTVTWTMNPEYTLVIYLSDTTEDQVHAAADELISLFHQSSVLIQANPTKTEFYSID